MSQEDDREVFPFPGKVKSSVWEFFGFYKNCYGNLDKSRAICKLCKRGINYSGNTTNLRTHIVHHHKNVASSQEYGYSRSSLNRSVNSETNSVSVFSSQSMVDAFLHAGTPPRGPRQTYCEEISVAPLPVDSSVAFSRNAGHHTNWVVEPGTHSGDSQMSYNKENPSQENSSGSFAESDVESYNGFMSVRELIFEMIIHDLLPIESLDASRFQRLIGLGRRNVIIPSSEDVTNMILKRHSELQVAVFSELTLASNKSFKIEFWETSCYHYVTIYVSALFDNWKMKNYTLCTSELPSDDVDEVTEILLEKITDDGLCGSIIVSDGNEIVDQFAESKNCILLEALCHTIEKTAKLCIQETVTANLIKKVQKVVRSFNKFEAKAVLAEKQNALNMPAKELVSCNVEVWTSCLEMFEIILDQSNAVIAACMDQTPSVLKIEKLMSADFALIQTLINILLPLKTALTLTKDMKYPTASVVLPVLKKLEISLANTDADSQIIAELKTKMISALKESYVNDNIKDFLLLSSFLDPRFKCLKFVNQSDQGRAYDLLKKSALDLKNQSTPTQSSSSNSPNKTETIVKIEVDDDYQEPSCVLWTDSGGKEKAGAIDHEPKSKKLKLQNQTVQASDSSADDWFADVILELKEDKAEEDSISVEINRYKCEMQVSSSASPLTWWRDRQKSFPLLSEVAKKYVFIPALLGTKDEVSEKLFKKQRNSIAPHLIEPVMFLHGNYDKLTSK